MPIEPARKRRPADYAAPTSSSRRITEAPAPAQQPAPTTTPAPPSAAAPPRAVNARIDAELAQAWDDRLTALALPRGAAHSAALRALLDLDDEELRTQVTAEMVRQKQDQIRRRTAR